MKKLISDKNANFDIIMSRKKESVCNNIKQAMDVCENP